MEALIQSNERSRHEWVKTAIYLSWFTVIYNLIEGIVAIYFGADDGSSSLLGFGADSLIEVASAILVLWRFKGEIQNKNGDRNLEKERIASRGIGFLFILLAALTVASSANQLRLGSHPTTSIPGLIVSIVSLSFMFYLWSSKRKAATALNSVAMANDADCSLACIKLSVILFVGSVLFALFPSIWWADPATGCILSVLIGKEGVETVKASFAKDFDGGCGCG